MSATRLHLCTASRPPKDRYDMRPLLGEGLSSGNSSTGFEASVLTCTALQNVGPVAMSSNSLECVGRAGGRPKNLWRCDVLRVCGGKARPDLHRRSAMPNNDPWAKSLVKTRGEADFVDNVAISFVVFGLHGRNLKVLCHQCPESGHLILPGGHLHKGVPINHSARKHLEGFATSDRVYHEQLQVVDDWELEAGSGMLRIVYYALLKPEQCERVHERSRCEPQWHSIDSAMAMAIEQEEVLRLSLQSLRDKAKLEPIIFHLLPNKFTLSNFQEAYEAVLNVRFRKSNFRRKVAKMKFLVRCQERQTDVSHRAAELYRFDENLYYEACKSGFIFSI